MPQYIVFVSATQYYLCQTLEVALEWRRKTGGVVYSQAVGLNSDNPYESKPVKGQATRSYLPTPSIPGTV